MSDLNFHFRLQQGPIHGSWAEQRVAGPDAGCVVVFRGTVRDHARKKAVVRLEYEAYASMAEAELNRIWREICSRHPVLRAAVEHSEGVVPVGECSVQVAIASAHRAPALLAMAEFMDALKVRVPLWKKEIYQDGSNWIGQGS